LFNTTQESFFSRGIFSGGHNKVNLTIYLFLSVLWSSERFEIGVLLQSV
jgi:hypothetical protein